jgi:hypothetical protein
MSAVKINVLKADIHDIGFAVSVFAANIKSLLPNLDANIVDDHAKAISGQIIHEQRFKKLSSDSTTIEQLLAIGFVAIDDTSTKVLTSRSDTYVSESTRIRAADIVRGLVKNYPPNVDLHIVKLANDIYKLANLADLSGLLTQSKFIYDVLKFKPFICTKQPLLKTLPWTFTPTEQKMPFAANKCFDLANKYINKEYGGGNLNFSNLAIFMQQVVSANLAGILYCQSEKYANIILARQIQYSGQDKFKLAVTKNMYDAINEFNFIYNKISQDDTYYKSIIKKIKDFKINNVANLKVYLNDKELEKIAAIKISKQNTFCAHVQAFAGFHALLTKQFRNIKEVVRTRISELSDYIEYTGKVANCKKCKEFLFCAHSIECVGMSYDEKDKILEPYKSGVSEGLVFCKYCKEKLLRIYDETALDSNMFNIIAHARALDRENENELPILREICSSSINHVLSSFIFKAEVSKAKLQKELLKIIAPPVTIQLHKLNLQFDSKEYHVHARLIAYVYTFVFFMETFLNDANIILRGTEKSQKEYLNYFGTSAMTKFQEVVSDTSQIRKYMLLAHESTKSIERVKSTYTTKADVAVSIMNTPIYNFLFNMYRIEAIQTNTAAVSITEADAYNSIVYIKDARPESFIYDAYEPTSAFWKGSILRDSYEYLLAFASDKCSVHNTFAIEFVPDDLPNYKAAAFNKSIADKLFAYTDNINKHRLIKSYTEYVAIKFNYKDLMAKMLPVNYVFDDKGQRRQWAVDIKDGRAIGLAAAGLKLSDKMPAAVVKLLRDKKLAPNNNQAAILPPEQKDISINKNRYDVILKINKKYDIGKIEFIGQSAGVPYNEFIKGNVIKSDIRVAKLHGYILRLIKNYNMLRYRPALFEAYFEKKDDILNIEQGTFPDIASGQFLQAYATIKPVWAQDNIYKFLQDYLLGTLEILAAANNKVLLNFATANLDDMFNADVAYSLGTATQSLKLEVQERDLIGDEDGEAAASKDDSGFLNIDDVDYDQDEDDVPEIAGIED